MTKMTLMGRGVDVEHDYTKRPGSDNPGGGIVTKFKYICGALPNIRMTKDIAEAGIVNMIECLWFHERDAANPDIKIPERVDLYEECKSLNLLLISDPSFCRMPDYYRQRIFDATDAIIVSSRYTENWIKGYAPHDKVVYIGDPIDTNAFNPTNPNRKKSIVGCSQVSTPKNIDMIIDIFSELPSDIDKGYIGSKDIWGGYGDSNLETELKKVSDWTLPNAMAKEIAWVYSNTMAYVADTKYDTYCYAMVEAMASGCWCFLGNHPLYDDGRPCFRFETADEAVQLIVENMDVSKGICEEAVQWVNDHYSYDTYRKSITELIGNQIIYE